MNKLYLLLIIALVSTPLYGAELITDESNSDEKDGIYDIYTVDGVEEQEIQYQAVTSGLDLSYDIHSIISWDSEDHHITVYNTGIDLHLKHDNGLSLDLGTTLNGPVGEIDSRHFEADTFIRELKANYEFEVENAVILFSVGKMPTGTKVNQDNPRDVSGVMGVRMSVTPDKLPAIQDWLDANNLKVTRIEITRYNSASTNRLMFSDLQEMDMTAYALHLSWKHRLHTFFIYKRPDQDSMAPEGITVGAAYSLDLPMDPNIFVLRHRSTARYLDLEILVLSGSIEVIDDTRLSITWSRADEKLSGSRSDTTDFAAKRKVGEFWGRKAYVKTGVKRKRNHQNGEVDWTYYFQVELN